MSTHTLRYVLDEEGISVMLGCAGNQLVSEQGEAIALAFREVELEISVDSTLR